MLAELVAAAGALVGSWETGPALPLARSEVAGAAWRDQIVVAGGFLADGQSSARVDAYTPRVQRWSRLPDLPQPVNHGMAAAGGGRLYVLGGYGAGGPLRDAFVLDGSRWRRLPSMPFARAAAGAAVIQNTLYVAGGVGPAGIARSLLAYDVRRKRWRTLPGPSPREHLGVTALRGRLYVVGGRAFGQLFSIVQRWLPRERRWQRLASLPEPRGGTAAGSANGMVISAGAESSAGTSAAVYAYTPATNRWRRLPDVPTARHGLAVVGVGATIHVIAGGPRPGLSVSSANESLNLAG
jgi:N-acetylneuraminic acid mutarotase